MLDIPTISRWDTDGPHHLPLFVTQFWVSPAAWNFLHFLPVEVLTSGCSGTPPACWRPATWRHLGHHLECTCVHLFRLPCHFLRFSLHSFLRTFLIQIPAILPPLFPACLGCLRPFRSGTARYLTWNVASTCADAAAADRYAILPEQTRTCRRGAVTVKWNTCPFAFSTCLGHTVLGPAMPPAITTAAVFVGRFLGVLPPQVGGTPHCHLGTALGISYCLRTCRALYVSWMHLPPTCCLQVPANVLGCRLTISRVPPNLPPPFYHFCHQ